IHVRCEDGKVEIRPIAGTRRRGKTPAEDAALEAELLADPKERAEHVMLVDLARNDLGRVCEFGSVQVKDLMIIERYSHVMHIVSQVEGLLAAGKTPYDLMRATFPAGTLSGAPKIRAMQIISELEQTARGPYGGCVGYFSFNGNLDCCIAIRTALLKNGKAYVQAGGGWVNDSAPEAEFQETVNKAKAMLKAVALAESFARERRAWAGSAGAAGLWDADFPAGWVGRRRRQSGHRCDLGRRCRLPGRTLGQRDDALRGCPLRAAFDCLRHRADDNLGRFLQRLARQNPVVPPHVCLRTQRHR